MNPLAELRASFSGWSDILAGRPNPAEHFRTDAAGLAAAAMTLTVAILLSVAARSAITGLPSAGLVLYGLFVQAVTMVALALTIGWTLRRLKLPVARNALLVPALYALSYMFVVGIPLVLVGPDAALFAVLGLGVLMFFAGRRIAAMPTVISVAFATVCVIVLVVVPNALYMLAAILPFA